MSIKKIWQQSLNLILFVSTKICNNNRVTVVRWQEWLLDKAQLTASGLVRDDRQYWNQRTGTTCYSSTELQPPCSPQRLNFPHLAEVVLCSTHCGNLFLTTMKIQNTATRSMSERKGFFSSSSLSCPLFSRKFTSLSFTFGWRQWDNSLACFNMSCRFSLLSSQHWDSLLWFI